MRYVALLRGVNAGGHRKVPKAEFKLVLEDLGLTDVVVYINSGNAVFTSASETSAATVQTALEDHFGFDIATLVIPATDIVRIAQAIPADWENTPPTPDKSGHQANVLYLFDEIDRPDTLALLGYDPDIEEMLYVPGAILQRIPRATQSKSSLQKAIGKKMYSQMTVRNVNTARRLAELVSVAG